MIEDALNSIFDATSSAKCSTKLPRPLERPRIRMTLACLSIMPHLPNTPSSSALTSSLLRLSSDVASRKEAMLSSILSSNLRNSCSWNC